MCFFKKMRIGSENDGCVCDFVMKKCVRMSLDVDFDDRISREWACGPMVWLSSVMLSTSV